MHPSQWLRIIQTTTFPLGLLRPANATKDKLVEARIDSQDGALISSAKAPLYMALGWRAIRSTFLPVLAVMLFCSALEASVPTLVISGAEGSSYTCGDVIVDKNTLQSLVSPPCQTIYDTGSLSVIVNGTTFSVGFGRGSTSARLASSLTTAIQTGLPSLTVTVSGSTISFSPNTVFLKDGSGNTDFDATATNVTTIALTTSNPSVTYGTSVTFTATVPSTATGIVTFKDGSTTLGTGTVSSGSATYTTSTLSAGSHTITASYSGDSNYSSLTSGGITETITAAASQTITVTTPAPPSAVYSSQFTVAATASSGLAVAYGSTGGCTNSGAIFTMTSGTTACTVTYSQSGNSSYSAAPTVTSTTTATLAPQATLTVTGVPGTAQPYSATFTVGSTGGSGSGAVSFTGTGACSASGTTVTMTSGTGTCSVTATKASDGNYASATSAASAVAASLAVQATLTVTGVPGTAQPYGTMFTVGITGGSGLGAVTFSGSGACSAAGTTVTMSSSTGTCSVITTKASDGNYANATSVPATVAATLATETTLTVTGVPGTAQPYSATFTVGSTGGSGTGAVSFAGTGACSATGTTVTMTSGTGTCSVTATKASDGNYASATSAASAVAASLAVQATLTVTGVPGTAQPYGATFAVGTLGGSGSGAVSFAGTGACSASGTTVTMTSGTGTCSVTATKISDGNYANASVSATVSAALMSPAVSISCSPGSLVYAGSTTCTALVSATDGTVAFYSPSTLMGQWWNGTPSGWYPTVGGNLQGSPIGVSYDGYLNYNLLNTGSCASAGWSGATDGGPFGLGTGYFYARWTGTFTSSLGGVYTIGVNASGGANVYVNGTEIVNNLSTSQSAGADRTYTQSGTINLAAAAANSIIVEYQQGAGCAAIQLLWTPPGQTSSSLLGWTLAPVNPGGQASVSGNISVLGTSTITALFSGDTNYTATTATTNVTTAAASVTQILSNANPSTYGSSVAFTSLISTGGAVPPGSVAFMDGSSTIGSGTVSTVSTTNLLTYSSALTGPSWTSGGANGPTATPNSQTDPLGGTNATALAFPATVGSEGYFQNAGITPMAGSVYTMSVWLRAPAAATVYLRLVESNGNDDQSMQVAVTTSWQRFSFTSSALDGTAQLLWRINEVTGQPATIIYAWGAQLEQSATVGPYVATSASTATGYGGIASINTSVLAAGGHSITAAYGGGPNVNASTSFVLPEAIGVAPAISVSTTSLPDGLQNVPYAATLQAGGGQAPYSWSISGGSLPDGLTLVANGNIMGTPLTTGVSNFTVLVTDAAFNTVNLTFNITVNSSGLMPQIVSLTPSMGGAGTIVTIVGTNFGTNQAGSSVLLNTSQAPILQWNNTKIVAVVPPGIGAGSVSLTVNVATSSSSASFVVQRPDVCY